MKNENTCGQCGVVIPHEDGHYCDTCRPVENIKAEAAPAKAGNSTRYMNGVFTPLDSEEVQSACRNLWDELDKRNAALLAALKMFAFDYSPSPRNLAQYRDAARSAIALAEGGDK